MRNEKENLKQKITRMEYVKKCLHMTCMVLLLAICVCNPVFAEETGAGAGVVTSGMQNLQDIVSAFVSSVGSIVVLWGLFEFGNALQSNDGMMQSAAFKRIGGGLIMTIGPQLLALLVSTSA